MHTLISRDTLSKKAYMIDMSWEGVSRWRHAWSRRKGVRGRSRTWITTPFWWHSGLDRGQFDYALATGGPLWMVRIWIPLPSCISLQPKICTNEYTIYDYVYPHTQSLGMCVCMYQWVYNIHHPNDVSMNTDDYINSLALRGINTDQRQSPVDVPLWLSRPRAHKAVDYKPNA